ncbi:coagulation factor XIII A chain-like [Takifugu flavidus]|uniref:coagulation factor XIII A chain-like n=1 Tax=Takifugu flavidus TaxID=433684 RepID=UPI0025446075|nr:coagulation factor XIII A chain-like [Takifugu flavidus]
MSYQQTNQSTGRYCKPIPNSNIDEDVDDTSVFGPTPRGQPPYDLSVVDVDMCVSTNKPNHLTSSYYTDLLVVRRGQQWVMRVTFSRPLNRDDNIQVEFLIGRDPSASKGSMVTVTFSYNDKWFGEILEQHDTVVTLGITPSADAIVGKYRTYVKVVSGHSTVRSEKNPSTDLYLLFNAWCPDDVVFLPNDAERGEYVLNDNGVIYMGAADNVSQRAWMYGQFEQGILDACIYIMDSAKMPIWDRNKVLKVIRVGSAMVNAQDDNGVLVGNWSDDYSMGTAPMAWTGSVKILLQYFSTGVPVCFAQCWVFAGVFNTFLRCLGIPARVITNFNSAHDNTGNLKTDLIFKPDGTPDRAETRDSIWNYHCWNEVFMKRTDLGQGFEGWQVVDSTPQETSDGYFRCGPASIAAIKSGSVSHPFDTGFVFAEVNSDLVYHKKDKYGNLTPYSVDTTHIGKCIYTKSVGGTQPVDITLNYKNPEGSPEDMRAMERAESYGIQRDHSDLSEQPVNVVIHSNEVYLGYNIELDIEFHNPGGLEKMVNALLSGSVVYYTGVISNDLKEIKFTATVAGNSMEHVRLTVKADDYMPFLGSQLSLRFILSIESEDQSVSTMKVVNLKTKDLSLRLSGDAVIHRDMFVTLSFTNPYPFALHNIFLFMEGSGVIDIKSSFYRIIDVGATVSWKEHFQPRLAGLRGIVAVMHSSNLYMHGYVILNIKD